MIDKATIDRIMDAAQIVDVVSEFVTLRKAGVNYKGLCPFHNEKTPSFVVSPSKGFCHCFSCGKGGNAVGFIMEHEQMTYPEALRWLAHKYNIEIKERELTDEEKKAESERESLFIVNEWAMKYFQDILYNHVDGRAIGMQYFRSRGFRDDTIKEFQLGFSLPERDALAKEAAKKGFQDKFLVETRLCYRKDNSETGSLQDRYWGRVIFPVHSVTGRIVAFGGRVLRTDGKVAKYVNSPESQIYHKSNELYGIYFAKQSITKLDRCYLVEGYTDVISMHQSGIENVVASSGTSLTPGQIRLIHRFTSNITVLYDGDAAGIHASIRGIDMLLAEGMNVKVLLLPDNDDPDSFARKHNATEYRNYMEEHQTDFIGFKTHLLIDGVTDPIKRSEAINSIVKSISVIPDGILRATYIRECAQNININEQTLINTMNKFIRNDIEEKEKQLQREHQKSEDATEITSPAEEKVNIVEAQTNDIEDLLMQAAIRHGNEIMYSEVETEDGSIVSLTVAQYIRFDLQRDNLKFSNDLYNTILDEAAELSKSEGFNSESYFMHHTNFEISKIATKLVINHYELSKGQQQQMADNSHNIQETVGHIMMDFKMNYLENSLKSIQQQMSQAGNDMEKLRVLMVKYKEQQQLRNDIAKRIGSDIIVK